MLTAFGVTNAWLAVLPVLAALVAAIVFAALATPRMPIGGLAPALYAAARLEPGLDRRPDRGGRSQSRR